MPNYQYTARNQNGTLVRGQLEGKSERSVKSKIVRMGYFPVSIREHKDSAGRINLPFFSDRVKSGDLVTFSWQLSALMGASISIADALASLEEETENPTLKRAIGSIKKDIQDGEPFSKGLSRFPNIFNPLFLALVRAGEIGGILDVVLNRLAIHLDKEDELRQRVKSAFAYPIIVSCLAIIGVTFMLLTVVPVFSRIFKSLNVELPLQTRLLIMVSDTMIHHWWLIPLVMIGGGFAYWQVKMMPFYRPFVDRLKLEAPMVGRLNRKISISRFVRTMSYLVTSGIPMMEALDLSGDVTGNVIMKKAVERIRKGVSEGEGLSKPIRSSGQFPSLVSNMVSAGEESGNLDTMLEKVADFYDRDVEFTLKRVITMLEPLLTVAMGLVVGFIAISMYLPIFNIAKAIHR